MTAYYEFSGIAKWAKLHTPDKKFQNYEIDLFVDDETLKAIKATGVQLKVREDKDGQFIKFRRPASKKRKDKLVEMGPVKVIKDGKRFTEEVGNGSEVTVLIQVYDTMKGPGHTLEMVKIDKLVAYDGGSKPEGWDYDDAPAFD